ncbi:protein O-GlcNAc transferase [Handroanthus impetiginosus]|uniref:Protein O-GlcNAc transferase n=1 Tax=Handroanthus impetiginosus TaxID=429701 RepID=A0A2G9GW22_9LAMI|nr:protein O-GlcNAc transferase [Handroanthus impetiginosus]
MEKSRRGRLLVGAAPLTFLLIVCLLSADFFGGNIIAFDQWMQHLSGSQLEEQKPLQPLLARLVRGKDRRQLEASGFACDVAENSIVCIANEPVRIDTSKNVTVYSSSLTLTVQDETRVKPYALQKDKYLLQYITAVKILHGNNKPPACQYNHDIPAVIFSSGISGNLFHEFNDIMIPLFITTKHFQSRVFLILEDYKPSFVTKFSKVISRLSSYEVMNPAANGSVHCFSGMILGLKYHDNLALNPRDIPGGHSMHDFRQFLAETYDLKFKHVSHIRKPTLMLISREKTRKFLNEDEMVTMIKELGFRVIVARTKEAKNLNKFANIVNSCGVLVGAHGAGLTNELFLPAGAVMVQVEPLGMEWAAANYYGNPACAMGVRYLRYKIEPEESSLLDSYGRNHSVIMDPASVYAKGYRAVRAVYLDQQDVRVDIDRFRKTIQQALRMVKMHL